ncbi:MAG: chlorophyll synthase ChlG [Pseudomonadota bacterium]
MAPPATGTATPSFRVRALAAVELLKPITWFAPMWAFGCGLVSAGISFGTQWFVTIIGLLLVGPMVCATSQAVNDWFDRHVDAINQPERPIPSGRLPGRTGFWIACVWTVASLGVGALLGQIVLAATVFALILAWIYSAPPLRLKTNGWWGNSAVAICYEGLPWFTAATIISGGVPRTEILLAVVLYSVGAHGIMTLNDFKSIEGDTKLGLRSLPVQLGADRACRLACWVMALPQLVMLGLLVYWDQPFHALGLVGLIAVQFYCMRVLLRDPCGKAPWYNATGTSLYVLGMLVTAFAMAPAS